MQITHLQFKLEQKYMHFIRKRDLGKKHAPENASTLLGDSDNRSEPTQNQQLSFGINDKHQKIANLMAKISNLTVQNWQKQSSELFGSLLDGRKTNLNSQQLAVYRESMIMVAKYQQELKKKGTQLSEETSSITLGLYSKILQQIVRLSQQQKHDQLIQDANIVESTFMNLQAFAATLEGEVSRAQKKPILMRKNSLKRIEQLPSIRPSSRGKLSSLSKKDNSTLNKQQLLGISRPKIECPGRSLIEQIVVHLCSIIKNLSANARLRKELLKDEYLRLINRYLCIWNDKTMTPTGNSVLMLLSASYRHLAVQDKSQRIFLQSNCFDSWARLIEVFPTNQDLMFNLLRTISKLSNYESCCLKLNQKKQCLKSLCSFFQFYKAHIHIIIRVAIIFANMTSYLADIRNQIYFDFKAWPNIFDCFEYYAARELSGKNQTDKMGLSMAAWDYQHIKKQSDIDCTIRIVRLIANLFTVAHIGQDIYLNQGSQYRELVKQLKSLLQKKANLQQSSELTATILSCLTNVLFYDKQVLMSNQQHRMVKTQLINALVDLVVQIDNQQICCQSLRVLANLTRLRQFCAVVVQAKIHQALIILLDSTSKEIVFYCLGLLSNLLVDNSFKQQYKQPILTAVISILNECQNDDFDVVSLALKTLAVIVDNRNQNLDPRLLAQIQNCLMNLGSHCDRIISHVGQQGQLSDIHQSRSLINMLLNSMPQQKFICPVKNCGRKFADDAKLQDHVKRRHKV